MFPFDNSEIIIQKPHAFLSNIGIHGLRGIFSFFISFFPSPLSSLAHFTQMGPKIVHTCR